MSRKRWIHLLVLSSSVAILPMAAQAQEAAGGTAEDGGLQDIVVTAQRQSESLQSTPLSVAAFTGEALRARGTVNVEDLAAQTPSLSIKNDFGAVNPNIYLRGVGIGDINANVTGTVGVYVDEVYKASPASQLMQFFDVARVEVLRGPQGTLYGRNTTAGAINIISKPPTEDFVADVTASYGRFDEIQLEGGASGALVPDTVRLRVSGSYHRRDGYIRNINSNPASLAPRRIADIDNWATRAQLQLLPGEQIDVLLAVHAGRSDTTGVSYNHRGVFDPTAYAQGRIETCGLARIQAYRCVDFLGYRDTDHDPDRVDINGVSRENVRNWGARLRVNADWGDVALTSISAYDRTRRASVFDIDDSPNSAVDAVQRARSAQISQELRLASTNKDQRFHWVAGGFYFRERLNYFGSFDLFRGQRPAVATAAAARNLGPPLTLGVNPAGNPALAAQLGSLVFAVPVFFVTYPYRQRVESWAAFGQGYLDLTDTVTLTGGLRYSDERRRFDYLSAVTEPFFTIPIAQTSAALGNNRTRFDDLSWRVAVDWQATRDLFGYASVSRGTKAGGFSGALLTSQAQTRPYRDERLTSYEVGLRSEFLDRRLRINATGFYYDYRDVQVYTLENNGGFPDSILSNLPRARVTGAELELIARPVEQLMVNVGASLLDTKIVSDFLNPAGVNIRGNELAYAPHLSISGSLSWTQPLGGEAGDLLLTGDFSRQGGSYTETNNVARLRAQGALILGLRAAYRAPGGRWELAAWGRNITDRRYITLVGNVADFGFDRVKYNAPATYGLSVRLQY